MERDSKEIARDKAAMIGGWGYSGAYDRIPNDVPLRKMATVGEAKPEILPKTNALPTQDVIYSNNLRPRGKKQITF